MTITHPPDFLFGGFKNGQWDGIVGQLLRKVKFFEISSKNFFYYRFFIIKEADMGASLNAITYARYTAVDFSVPVIYDVTGILIPFPDETSKIMAAFLPFSIEVIFILLILIEVINNSFCRCG